ncbi:MAG: HD domain-containing protein [Lachnospiraceae bacterium]|nr:HD domain-containing protein [Lachnospiraceae bacterium]
MSNELVAAPYYLVALIAAYIVLKAYRKNTSIGNKIGRVMLAAVFLIVFYSFNLVSDIYLVKSLGYSLSYIMLDIMLVCFFDYIVEFLDFQDGMPSVLLFTMVVGIVVDGIFLLSNVIFENVVEYRLVPFLDEKVLLPIPQAPFTFHLVFLGVVLAAICLMLSNKLLHIPHSYRKRYYLLIVGLFLAVLVNVMHLNGVMTFRIDVSAVSYGILGILMYFNTFHYNEMVKRNLTRNLIMDYLSEPILLFDYKGRLSEASDPARELLPVECLRQGLPIYEFFDKSEMGSLVDIHKNQDFHCAFLVDGAKRTFDCRFSCMQDKRDKVVGYMLLLHDVTQTQDAYFALEQSIVYDPMTGLYNKQSFYNQLPQWEDDRYWPVSICVCNIDNLKKLNKEKGLQYGDRLLKELAQLVKKNVGVNNYIAKMDESDIVAMVENTGESEAAAIFERIREEMSHVDKQEEISLEYGIYVVDSLNPPIRVAVDEARSSMRRKKMLKHASASSSLVESLKQTLTESDFQTEEHVERTQEMAARLGKEMNLSDVDIAKLELLAVLHDIGKVAIPQHVLRKKSKLTDEERMIIQQHTVKGYRIAKSSPELEEIAEGILAHHERWDGSGYPNGWKGEEIPLLARVISAID